MGHEEPSKGDTCLAGKVGLPPSDGYQASGLDRYHGDERCANRCGPGGSPTWLPHARHIREKACAPEPSQPVAFLNLRNPPPIVRHLHGPFRGHQEPSVGASTASPAERYSSTRLWSQTMRPASVGASAVRIKDALVRPETMDDIMRIWNLNELFRKR
jgi:hypothetical protein